MAICTLIWFSIMSLCATRMEGSYTIRKNKQMELSKGAVLHDEGIFTLTGDEWRLILNLDFTDLEENFDLVWTLISKTSSSIELLSTQTLDPAYKFIGDMVKEILKLKYKGNLFLLSQIGQLREAFLDFRSTILGIDGEPDHRIRRGMIDAGGEIGKVLFGLSTVADVEEVQKHVETLSKTTEEVVHLVDAQTTVVKAIHKELSKNRNAINKLSELSLTTDRILGKLENEILRIGKSLVAIPVLAQTMTMLFAIQEQEDMVTRIMGALQNDITQLITAVETISSERLSQYFLSSANLTRILDGIRLKLPSQLGLAIDWKKGHLFSYYHELPVTTIANEKSITLVIDIPLTERDRQFKLLRMVPWPTPRDSHDNLAVMMDIGQKYIALSADRQSFIELSEEEAKGCKAGVRVCTPNSPIYSQPITSCLYRVARNQDIQDYCQYIVMNLTQPQFKYVERTDTWLYYLKDPVKFTLKCLTGDAKDFSLNGAGLFHLPGNCSAHAPGIVLPRRFMAQSTVDVKHSNIYVPKIVLPKWNLSSITPTEKYQVSHLLEKVKVTSLKEVKHLGSSITQLQNEVKQEEQIMVLRKTIDSLEGHKTGLWTGTTIIIIIIAITGIVVAVKVMRAKKNRIPSEPKVPKVRFYTRPAKDRDTGKWTKVTPKSKKHKRLKAEVMQEIGNIEEDKEESK